jgi:hypothetical protein
VTTDDESLKREHAVHARQRDDDLVVHGHAAAHETRVATLRHDGQRVRVAVLHHGGDLRRGARAHNNDAVGLAGAVFAHPVGRVGTRVVARGDQHAATVVVHGGFQSGNVV